MSPQSKLRRGKASPKTSMNSQRPNQIRSNIQFSHTYRFTSTSGTATAITANSLACAAGTVCVVGNSTVYSLFAAVKMNQISIWSPSATQGAFATCSVEWSSTLGNTSTTEVSDTSVSTASPAHLVTGPPRASLASFWNNNVNAASTLCTITAPTGSIIDVSVSVILVDDNIANPFDASIATGTLGNFYYLSLDPNATHRYVPVSLTTTT